MQLKKNGRRTYNCLCPFHSENTPSFTIYSQDDPQNDRFHCFGCGADGDQINLYAMLNHLENGQAIAHLAHRIGLKGKKITRKQQLEVSRRQKDRQLEKLFKDECNSLFRFFCDLRKHVKERAEFYGEEDSLLVYYRQKETYYDYLLDGLLEGLNGETQYDDLIEVYKISKEVRKEWNILLAEHVQTYLDSME